MAATLTAAGFIIADDAAIWGLGATEDEAWADLRREMSLNGVRHESEVAEEDREWFESWSEGTFTVIPATAALMDKVKVQGGRLAWGRIGDVACTVEEEDAA